MRKVMLSPLRSLSNRIVLFTLISAVLPMLLLTLIINSLSSNNVLNVARERIDAEAIAGIERIELYLRERRSDAQVLAALSFSHDALQSPDADTLSAALSPLEAVRESYGYSALSLLDRDGRVLLSTDPALRGQDQSTRPEIQSALQGAPATSEVRFEIGGDTPFVFFTAPVRAENGQIIGALSNRMALDHIHAIVDADTGRSGIGSYSVLMDTDGIRLSVPSSPELLMRPIAPLPAATAERLRREQRFADQTNVLIAQASDFPEVISYMRDISAGSERVFFNLLTNDGEASESVVRALESVPWFYTHRVPNRSFAAVVNQQMQYALLLTGVAAIASIGVTYWFIRGALSRPLSELLQTARAIAGGDLNRRLRSRRNDEIGELADSFDLMAESLQQRIVTEQEAQAEARRLQHIEAENRALLERTVADYLAFTQQVAAGDLTHRIEIKQNGALGQLGESLNSMVAGLRNIAGEVQAAAGSIASAAAEILAATSQQASSAAQQSSSVTETTTTIEQVKTIAEQSAAQAGQVAEDSQSALGTARQGLETVEETVEGMNQLQERVDTIAQTILALSERTQAIGDITKTVGELADQSNLLAINAALEASRAGKQGRSFAVVAQNVRDLADRSKKATSQVRDILDEIKRATDSAVLITEEGTRGAREGTQRAQRAGDMIHRIAGEVERGVYANSQMAEGARQATTGLQQVEQAMLSIRQATSQALAGTRQAERAAQDLHMLAQSLQKAIAAYRL
jgi:methyl-accepting chemotaxis protein